MCGVSEPQRWGIFVPRLHQNHVWPSSNYALDLGGSSNVLFRTSNHWNAWSKLVRIPSSAQDGSPQQYSSQYVISTISTVESLPSELLSLIISSPCLSKRDIIAFGLASPIFWPHVLRYISLDCKQPNTSWAGLEIAKIGERLTDLPINFMRDSLFASSIEILDPHALQSPFSSLTARRLYDSACERYKPAAPYPHQQWMVAFTTHRNQSSETCKLDFFSALNPILRKTLMKAWLLRNLTTKEYIRCRFDIESQRAFVETWELRLSIEDALELRFRWPSSSNEPPHKGTGRDIWAGHCFDIVLATKEIPGMGLEGWRNVTEVVVKDAKMRLRSLEASTRRHTSKYEDYQLARKGAKDLWFNKGLVYLICPCLLRPSPYHQRYHYYTRFKQKYIRQLT